MSKEDLFLHLTEITRAFDEGVDFTMLSDAERHLMRQKIIAATVALDGLAAELEQAGS